MAMRRQKNPPVSWDGKKFIACRFDWTAISPTIFGALFQSVMHPVQHRAQGAHYTTEQNILKVIEPLFLDDLRAEFARLKARLKACLGQNENPECSDSHF